MAGSILCTLIRKRVVRIVIPVDRPQSKQSTSFGHGHAFTPAKKRKYLKYLASEIRRQYNGKPLDGIFFLEVVYYFKKGREHDEDELMSNCADVVDNLNKPVCDALSGVVIQDDRKFCGALVFKARSSRPRIEVTVFRVIGVK